jgi:hypothetical protein
MPKQSHEAELLKMAVKRVHDKWGRWAEDNLGRELYRAVVSHEVLAIIAAQDPISPSFATKLASHTLVATS